MSKLEIFKTKLQQLDCDKREFVLKKLQVYSDSISENSNDSVVGGIKKAKSYIAAAYLSIAKPGLNIEQINHADVRGLGACIFSGGTVIIMSPKGERVLGEANAQVVSDLQEIANEYGNLSQQDKENFKEEVMDRNIVKISSHQSKVCVSSTPQKIRV